MQSEEMMHREKWYELYLMSNYLNENGAMSDLWFWFLARRENWDYDTCREELERTAIEEIGLPEGGLEELWRNALTR